MMHLIIFIVNFENAHHFFPLFSFFDVGPFKLLSIVIFELASVTLYISFINDPGERACVVFAHIAGASVG